MDDDELKRRLSDADAAFAAVRPASANIDAAAIRARARRQSLRGRVTAATMALVIGIAGLISVWRLATATSELDRAIAQEQALSPGEIEAIKRQIAALDAEARHTQALVDRLRHADRLAEARDELARLPADAVDLSPSEQVERAAGIGVISADFFSNELNRPHDAAESYRSVLKHFPGSRWAAVARERLSQIEMMN